MMKRWIAVLILAVMAAGVAAGYAEPEAEMDKVFVICQIDSHVIVRSSPRKKGIEYAIGEAGEVFYDCGGKQLAANLKAFIQKGLQSRP